MEEEEVLMVAWMKAGRLRCWFAHLDHTATPDLALEICLLAKCQQAVGNLGGLLDLTRQTEELEMNRLHGWSSDEALPLFVFASHTLGRRRYP